MMRREKIVCGGRLETGRVPGLFRLFCRPARLATVPQGV